VLLVVIDSSENAEHRTLGPQSSTRPGCDDGPVPAAECVRRLWVRWADLRRGIRRWWGCTDSEPSYPHFGTQRFDPQLRPKAKQHPSRTCKTLVRSSPRATGIYVVAASFVSALHWRHLPASFQQCPQWGIAGDCQCACKVATLRRLLTFEAR